MRSLRRQTRLLPAFTGSEFLYSTSRSLLPTIRDVHHAASITSISTSHTSASTMPVTTHSLPPAKRPKKPKFAPTQREILRGRLDVLNAAISIYNCRTNLGKKQRNKLLKHTQEKAAIEIELAALRTSGLQDVAIQALNCASPLTVHTQDEVITAPAGARPLANEPPQSLPRSPLALGIQHPNISGQPVSTVTQLAVKSSLLLPVSTAPAAERRQSHSDEIVPPSAASGGVPEPTPLYLSNCNMVPQFTAQPQHLLLVLDLNGTLLVRPNRNKPRHFVERPSTQQFLNYVMANFSVMIWSSAKPANVQYMCEKLFPGGSRQRLLGIWGRDRLGLSKEDCARRVQVYKRLDSIWNDPQIQSNHPLANQGGRWHQGNTVLLDDSPEKSRSEPHNFVEIIEFNGAPEDPNILRDVAEYLTTLRMQMNVSSYIRQYPLRIIRGPS
jgi:hypothetical protein